MFVLIEFDRYLENDLISETSKEFTKLVLAILKVTDASVLGYVIRYRSSTCSRSTMYTVEIQYIIHLLNFDVLWIHGYTWILSYCTTE